jgi:hypothetical protein
VLVGAAAAAATAGRHCFCCCAAHSCAANFDCLSSPCRQAGFCSHFALRTASYRRAGAYAPQLPMSPSNAPPANCAGSNEANQLGAQQDDVQLGSSREPVVVADPSLAFTSLAAADTFSCGVLANATAVCWGGYTDASQSELLPAGLRELKPKQPQLFAALAARGSTVCGLTLQHSILCSGGRRSSSCMLCRQPPLARDQCCAALALPLAACWEHRPLGQGSLPWLRLKHLAGLGSARLGWAGLLCAEACSPLIRVCCPLCRCGRKLYRCTRLPRNRLLGHANPTPINVQLYSTDHRRIWLLFPCLRPHHARQSRMLGWVCWLAAPRSHAPLPVCWNTISILLQLITFVSKHDVLSSA